MEGQLDLEDKSVHLQLRRIESCEFGRVSTSEGKSGMASLNRSVSEITIEKKWEGIIC
jgi:hypothetical protein